VTIIPLVQSLLTGSSNLPGSFGRVVLKRFPIWSCSVRGLACHLPYGKRGALLPHLFTLTTTCTQRVRNRGGMFSVPLSFRSPWPGITRRTTLRSSDFPPRRPITWTNAAIVWPPTTDFQRSTT